VVESFIIGVLTVLLLLSIYGIALFKKQSINSALQNAQLLIDKNILQEKLVQLNEDKRLVESEEFMQFMISSREYAFTYIEAVQDALNEYKKVMEPKIAYHKSYGMVLGETRDWQNMEDISKAYETLMDVLPKDNDIKNN
jgi:hypothetical protein